MPTLAHRLPIPPPRVIGHCAAEGCGIPMVSSHFAVKWGVPADHSRHDGRGLCRKHYERKAYGRGGVKPCQVRACSVCGRPMVSRYAAGVYGLAEGQTVHGAHGMCARDYNRSYNRSLVPESRRRNPNRRATEVLEDYETIRESCRNVAEAAERMGMTRAALNQALVRARRKGIMILPPPAQVERAIVKNCAPAWYYQTTRRSAA